MGRPLSKTDIYEHTWMQLIRVAKRCGYWYDSSDPLSANVYEQQVQLVQQEMCQVFEKIHDDFEGDRNNFTAVLGDEVLSKIEGPRGLGSTTKAEFQRAIRHALWMIRACPDWQELKFFDNLCPTDDDMKPGELQAMAEQESSSETHFPLVDVEK